MEVGTERIWAIIFQIVTSVPAIIWIATRLRRQQVRSVKNWVSRFRRTVRNTLLTLPPFAYLERFVIRQKERIGAGISGLELYVAVTAGLVTLLLATHTVSQVLAGNQIKSFVAAVLAVVTFQLGCFMYADAKQQWLRLRGDRPAAVVLSVSFLGPLTVALTGALLEILQGV